MSEEILINGKKITELLDMFFEYCKLKKENEELKTYIQKMDKPEIKTIDSEIALKNIELQEKNKDLKEKNKSIAKDYVDVFGDYQKYKQALEEIKEIILGFGNTPIEFKTLNIPLKEEDLKTNEGKFFDFYTKLKDKINEALNDRN